MVHFFPKQISYRAIIVYLVSLTLVSLAFYDYAMDVGHIVMGVGFVTGFFLISNVSTQQWREAPERQFIAYIFLAALLLRLVWVVASYFFYIDVTGIPFELDTADARGYHKEAEWLASEPWSVARNYYFGAHATGISDVGYPLYLTVLYKLFGPIIIIPRIIKAFLSAWMCILLYRLCSRTFGLSVGRMAGIMCALMPNLIIYCGYHLKETEMLFLVVAFLER